MRRRPDFPTMTADGLGHPPEMDNERQSLRGDDLLPAAELPIKQLFPAHEIVG